MSHTQNEVNLEEFRAKVAEAARAPLLERIAQLESELVKEAARTAEEKLRASQITQQHDMQCKMHKEAVDRAMRAESELEAIGAGGVEALRSAAAPQAVQPLAWAAVYFAGPRMGKIYTTCDTEKQCNAYIAQVHQSNDSITLTAKPIYTHPTQLGLEQFMEQVGDVHFQRCRVGSKEGEIRWDIEFGHYGAEVRGKTLREAITKALAAQAKRGGV